MRTWVTVLCLTVAFPAVAKRGRSKEKDPENRLPRADIPQANEDLSARRIDAEVWGWSKNYSKVGAVALDVNRTREGAHRGWTFIVILPVGSVEPEINVMSSRVTMAALPHNPEPLKDIRDLLWTVDHAWKTGYPKRPKKKRPKRAMKVEPIWEFVEADGGVCTPAVGFLVDWKGQRRYQPHLLMKITADCELMRYGDHRTYWAKQDLAATMIRFDWGPKTNEASARFPLSAAWHLARPLRIRIEGRNLEKAHEVASRYGKVDVAANGRSDLGWIVHYATEDLLYLAHRIAAQLDGSVSREEAPPPGVQILLRRSRPPVVEPEEWQPTLPDSECGGLLRDCGK